MNFYSTLYLILALFSIEKINSEEITCQGYVDSFIQLDLSKIKIKLYTEENLLKYDAECNPQNGKFLIPIYNKGKYLVKIIAPDGYVFDAESHEIEINKDNECSEELNFNLIGLKVSGTILNGQDSSLVLGLFEQNGKKLIEQTIADKGGHYSFVTKPGHYVISLISGSTQCLSQGSVEIEVSTMPVTVKPDLRINGSLLVNVRDEKGDPVPTATVILYSNDELNIKNLPKNVIHPSTQIDQKFVYYLKTSGLTSINCLPPGNYIIGVENRFLPHFDFNFEKKIIDLDSDTEITISVETFNINGIVITAGGAPLKDVIITMDGMFYTRSDEEGKFTFSFVNSGRHYFKAQKIYFEILPIHIDVSSKMEPLTLVSVGITQSEETINKAVSIVYGWGSLISAYVACICVSLAFLAVISGFLFYVFSSIKNIESDLMLTKDNLKNIENDLKNKLTKEDIKDMLTKDNLKNIENDLKNKLTKEDIKDVLTKNDLRNYFR